MFHAGITVCVRNSLSVCMSVCPSFVLKIGGEGVGGWGEGRELRYYLKVKVTVRAYVSFTQPP